MESYFLGIDGGGTTCRARLVDSGGQVLGEGRGGPSNTTLGVGNAYAEILRATLQSLEQAGLPEDILSQTHAGFGLAGLPTGRDRELLLNYNHPFASVSANTDAYVACLGAHGGKDGGILILGTGSCGYGLVEGKGFSIGGWGFKLSDQASGAYVGFEAVRAALQSHDGILPPSDLARDIMEKFDHIPEKAVIWSETARPVDYGMLAPLVVQRATEGDSLACFLMEDAAHQADLLIQALLDRGVRQVACLGGFYKYLKNWLSRELDPILVDPQGDALDGAIMMARQHRNQQQKAAE